MHSFLDRKYRPCQSFDVPDLTPPPRIRSERAGIVAKWFGIDEAIRHCHPAPPSDARGDRALLRSLLPGAGRITFLTGPSGAGKSTMLRALQQPGSNARFIDLATIDPPDVPLVDCFDGCDLDQTLALLAQVGLGEAWTYLQTPSELSEGQRWRLKLAMALKEGTKPPGHEGTEENSETAVTDSLPLCLRASAPSRVPQTILLIDEFAAVLDRITAMVLARSFHRVISGIPNLGAIVATSHDDLTRALAPDTIVNCDFRFVEVRRKRQAICEGDLNGSQGILRSKSRPSRDTAKPQAAKRHRSRKPRGLVPRFARSRSIRRSRRSRANVPTDAVATRCT